MFRIYCLVGKGDLYSFGSYGGVFLGEFVVRSIIGWRFIVVDLVDLWGYEIIINIIGKKFLNKVVNVMIEMCIIYYRSLEEVSLM